MTQLIATLVIVAVAIAYAVWRICQAFRHTGDSCCGCEGCPLGDAARINRKKGACRNCSNSI